jgi:hypothetical protein
MKSANHLGGLASAITLVGNTMRRPGYAAPKALWLARMSPNLVGGISERIVQITRPRATILMPIPQGV